MFRSQHWQLFQPHEAPHSSLSSEKNEGHKSKAPTCFQAGAKLAKPGLLYVTEGRPGVCEGSPLYWKRRSSITIDPEPEVVFVVM